MAFSHGTNAVLKVDDSADVLTDISTFLTSTGLPRSVDAYDTTTLGKTARTRIPGLEDGTIPLEGKWDPTIDAFLDGIRRQADKDFEFYPDGTATGKVKYAGQCLLTSYEISTPVDAEKTFSAELALDDTVTRSLVP